MIGCPHAIRVDSQVGEATPNVSAKPDSKTLTHVARRDVEATKDEAMLKALTNKLQSLQEKNHKLKEDLLLEEPRHNKYSVMKLDWACKSGPQFALVKGTCNRW